MAYRYTLSGFTGLLSRFPETQIQLSFLSKLDNLLFAFYVAACCNFLRTTWGTMIKTFIYSNQCRYRYPGIVLTQQRLIEDSCEDPTLESRPAVSASPHAHA